MLVGQLNDLLDLLLVVRVDHHVHKFLEFSVSQRKDLHQGCAMGVHDSLPLQERAAVESIDGAELLKEVMVEVGSGDFHVSLLGRGL